jgi:hypothetical protein
MTNRRVSIASRIAARLGMVDRVDDVVGWRERGTGRLMLLGDAPVASMRAGQMEYKTVQVVTVANSCER